MVNLLDKTRIYDIIVDSAVSFLENNRTNIKSTVTEEEFIKLFEKTTDEIFEIFKDYITNNDTVIIEKLKDPVLNRIYIQLYTEMTILQEGAIKLKKEVENINISEINGNSDNSDVIEEAASIVVPLASLTTTILVSAFYFYLIFVKKIPARIINKFTTLVHRVSKVVERSTRKRYVLEWFYKNIPNECLKYSVAYSNAKTPDAIKAKIKQLTTFPVPIVSKDVERLKTKHSKLLDCSIRFFIQYTGLILNTFYQCLYDHKQFLDLIKIKEKPIDLLIKLDKTGIEDFENLVSSACYKHYEYFKEYYELVVDFINTVFPRNTREFTDYMKLLHKTVIESSKLAQRLLDEGKKQLHNEQRNENNKSQPNNKH